MNVWDLDYGAKGGEKAAFAGSEVRAGVKSDKRLIHGAQVKDRSRLTVWRTLTVQEVAAHPPRSGGER